MKKLLLISNSTLHGSGYLDHCEDLIKKFLGGGVKKIMFIPFARPGGISYDEYTAKARERFQMMGIDVVSVHETVDPVSEILQTEAVFTGGGNSFVLLNSLYNHKIVEPLKQRIEKGMPYIGTSAGSNIACPSIMTTNDMPIVYPESFNALNQVPFQINPHYLDPDPSSTHKGETRETRIKEFLVFNDTPVIGLREGSMIWCEGDRFLLEGTQKAVIFKKNQEPYEVDPGEYIKIITALCIK